MAVGLIALGTVALGGAPALAVEAEPAQAAAAEPQGVEAAEPSMAGLADLRKGAGMRLSPELRAKLEQMSDEAVLALANPPEGAQPSEEDQAIRTALWQQAFEGELRYQSGDISIGGGLATLRLAEDFRYLDEKDAERLLVEGWGNPPGNQTLGMIVPADVSPLDATRGWAVVVTYSEEGHVEDDDAEDIDYDDLLAAMKEDTAKDSEQRVRDGYGAMELVGWAATPHYDAQTHRLYWAKELKFSGAPENTVNYAIRVLGRKGVLELNAVAGMSQLAPVQREMERILPRAEFATGSTYADFNPGIDKVAAYGIGGLIAGKVLAKAGVIAVLLKLLVAGKKFIILGVIGLGALVAKVLRGRNSAE